MVRNPPLAGRQLGEHAGARPFARSRGCGHCISSPRRRWMTPQGLRRGRSIFCSASTGSRPTSLAICRNTSAPTLTCPAKRWQFSSPGSSYRSFTASRKRAHLGRRVLVDEATRQVNADGGHAELSAHYHRYSTDFYLLATLVARRCGDEATSVLEESAARQAKFLRAIADDNGRLPQIGDDDGGQLFPICGRPASDCSDTLSQRRRDSQRSLPHPRSRDRRVVLVLRRADRARRRVGRRDRVAVGSAAFPSSGYYVSRTTGGDHLVFDAGRHGYLNGGHAHADALSVVLTTAGRPLLVDPGTGTYIMAPAMRDLFRSTAMHNTVVLDGRPQSAPRGPFHWSSRADARCLVWHSERDFDYVEGIHDGYLPKAHARAVLALHGTGWLVIDHVLGPPGVSVTADTFWHIHPAWTLAPTDGDRPPQTHRRHRRVRSRVQAVCARSARPKRMVSTDIRLFTGGSRRRFASRPEQPPRCRTPWLRSYLASNTSAVPVLEQLRVNVPPPTGWHGVAFSLRWRDGEAVVLSAIESSAVVSTAGSPGAIWGCELATTDARMAVIPLSNDRRMTPVLIHGTQVEPVAGPTRA